MDKIRSLTEIAKGAGDSAFGMFTGMALTFAAVPLAIGLIIFATKWDGHLYDQKGCVTVQEAAGKVLKVNSCTGDISEVPLKDDSGQGAEVLTKSDVEYFNAHLHMAEDYKHKAVQFCTRWPTNRADLHAMKEPDSRNGDLILPSVGVTREVVSLETVRKLEALTEEAENARSQAIKVGMGNSSPKAVAVRNDYFQKVDRFCLYVMELKIPPQK